MTFKKGVSGNPLGRKLEKIHYTKRCRDAVDRYVIAAWEEEVATKGENWVKCSELLAGYALGKPHQAQSIDITATQPTSVEERLISLDDSVVSKLAAGEEASAD
jgi:hypothetical protein